ncbi:MAG TPA: DUF6544 family protein [Candidatus Obscuribacterales bacterium]
MNKLTLALALTGIALSLGLYQSGSIRRLYKSEVLTALSREQPDTRPVSEADLAALPAPVQKYLRYVGVVGKPRVHNFRVLSHGEIRQAADQAWMPVQARQYGFVCPELSRTYYISSSGLPMTGRDAYTDGHANMRITLAGIVPIADARGPEMDRSGLVTMLSDMSLYAPATLIDARIRWEPVDALSARAHFSDHDQQISALLRFNARGELIDFVSDDRSKAGDHNSYERIKWSTPVRNYRDYHGLRLASEGEGIWHLKSGDLNYVRIRNEDIRWNLDAFE